MVTIGMNYQVLPGKQENFENAFRKVLQAMTGVAGHSQTHMYRDIDSDTSYLIISEWSDRAAYDDFIASDAFKQVTTWGKEQILAGRPSHQVYGA